MKLSLVRGPPSLAFDWLEIGLSACDWLKRAIAWDRAPLKLLIYVVYLLERVGRRGDIRKNREAIALCVRAMALIF